jgi:hypothetical protein
MRIYVGYIDRMIVPAIGSVGIDRLTARMLERSYHWHIPARRLQMIS